MLINSANKENIADKHYRVCFVSIADALLLSLQTKTGFDERNV